MEQQFKRTVKTPEQVKIDREERERKLQERERKLKEKSSKKKEVKASWNKIKQEPAVIELVKFLEIRRSMIISVAISSIGQDVDSKEKVRLSRDERISQMDRIAGLDEAIDYIKRHTV
jgi:hypothetical protein